MVSGRQVVTESGLQALLARPGDAVVPRIIQRAGNPWSPAGERLILEVEAGVRLQARLRRPAGASGSFTLLVDERGARSRDQQIEGLVGAGHTVLALDVRGTGDLAPAGGVSGYTGAYQFAARTWLLGTSVVAWQVQDIRHGLAAIRAEARGALDTSGPALYAQGQTVPAALFAAQFDKPGSVVLEEGLVSYLDFATADMHEGLTLTVVPGILRTTDLPELMSRIAPVPVRLVNPRTAAGAAITVTTLPAHLGTPVPANVTIAQ